jgi:hypothetical protein
MKLYTMQSLNIVAARILEIALNHDNNLSFITRSFLQSQGSYPTKVMSVHLRVVHTGSAGINAVAHATIHLHLLSGSDVVSGSSCNGM